MFVYQSIRQLNFTKKHTKNMAEAVKNNSRRRRPPSHFHQGYNEDDFQPGNNQYHGNKDHSKQGNDPLTLQAMARLMMKFVNSANKKQLQRRIKKKQEQIASSTKKQNAIDARGSQKVDKIGKQDKNNSSFKSKEQIIARQVISRQDLSKQKNQQKNLKKNNIIPQSNINQVQKTPKTQPFTNQPPNFPVGFNDMFNRQLMAKMRNEQFLKSLPKNVDPNLIRAQLTSPTDPQSLRSMANFSQNLRQQIRPGMNPNQFRQDTKLFKRASFHVGIAYNIHIQNVKNRNPNFSPDQLDPTFISRKLKQQSADAMKKQSQQQQRMRLQQQLLRKRQYQLLYASNGICKKQQEIKKQIKAQSQNSNKSPIKNKQVFINLQDDSEPHNQNVQIKYQQKENPQQAKPLNSQQNIKQTQINLNIKLEQQQQKMINEEEQDKQNDKQTKNKIQSQSQKQKLKQVQDKQIINQYRDPNNII